MVTLTEVIRAEESFLRITVVFDNVRWATHVKTSWGFSCLVEVPGHIALFDTGGNGSILLSNMNRLGIDATTVNTVFLSHIHHDHVGGLESFLEKNPEVVVCLPGSFPASFQRMIESYGAHARLVCGPTQLFDRMSSIGEMGNLIKEQGLILEATDGLVIITGCAHPGVTKVVRKAKEHFNKKVYLLIGGFHLEGIPKSQTKEIVTILREMGIRKVAPSHCTGQQATSLMREAWGDDFVESGVGAIIKFQ